MMFLESCLVGYAWVMDSLGYDFNVCLGTLGLINGGETFCQKALVLEVLDAWIRFLQCGFGM